MKYHAKLTEKAKKDLLSLDFVTQKRIKRKLYFYLAQKSPITYAKKIKNDRLGDYRFRIGDYRVIFDIDSRGNIVILLILRIKHRKEAYL
jgi:mRNA interferase RelE/StbE